MALSCNEVANHRFDQCAALCCQFASTSRQIGRGVFFECGSPRLLLDTNLEHQGFIIGNYLLQYFDFSSVRAH